MSSQRSKPFRPTAGGGRLRIAEAGASRILEAAP